MTVKKASLFLCLSLAATAQAQNPNLNYRYGIKVYNLSSWESYTRMENYDNTIIRTIKEHDNRLLHPAFAFQWKDKKNNFREIELTDLSWAKEKSATTDLYNQPPVTIPVSGTEQTKIQVALRYEYILNFNKRRNGKWMPALGFALNPYGRYSYSEPVNIATTFPVSSLRAGIKGFVVPRLIYHAGSRLFFDLNVPVCIADGYMLSENHKDPNLGVAQQKTTTWNFEGIPPFYSLRIGAGIKI